ncbi:MAG: response regulator [Deltaproteobacteria bacterium]|jgi:CheY-like chemotaxis protein|nr:response regulator [Deltaproteobacteria bacterium]
MSKQKILVVDDSPTIIKVVELVLTKSGYEVYSAQDGHAGIQLAKQYHPDLILLDFVMPKMNGYQVCKNLSENEELKDIPVVLMSAKGEQIGERFVKVMGIVDYITKPFSPEAIKAVVAKYADEKVDEPEQQIAEKSPEELEQQIQNEQKSRNTALVKLKSVIARKISAVLVSSGNLDGGRPDNEQIQSIIKNSLDDSFLESCFVNLENENFFLSQSQKEICLIGKIINIPIDEVLPLLSSLNSNGILTISKSNKKIEIYFQNGKIALASFNGKPNKFLLGQYIVEKEYIEQE